MPKYGVCLIFSYGEELDDEKVFNSYDEAYDYGCEMSSNYHQGEVYLAMSKDPEAEDYDYDDDVEIQVYEIED